MVTIRLSELKISSLVVEMEILPRPKVETYYKEVQVDLIVPEKQAATSNNLDDSEVGYGKSAKNSSHPV